MTLVRGVGFAILMLFSMSSQAEPKWETFAFPQGQGALSISDQACTVPTALMYWGTIRAAIKEQRDIDIGEAKLSRLLWKGRVYAGCYVVGPDDKRVYNRDSTGEGLRPAIPRDAFVPHEEALPKSKGTSV